MRGVIEPRDKEGPHPIQVDLFIDRLAFDRFGRVLRHLLVGLVDQACRIRLVSADPRVESLTLGPVTTVLHEPLRWPLNRRRTDRLLDALSPQPPTVVHALSAESFDLARSAAETFDADLILQVTSVADCSALASLSEARVGRYIAFTRPLASLLEEQLRIPTERISVVKAGITASKQPACFAQPKRTPTLVSFSPFARGGGVDVLIEAAHLLLRRQRDFLLFLLGEGRRESYLRRLIRHRELSARITLAHPTGNFLQTMQSADLYLRPAPDAAFEDDVLHAMGCGAATVVTAGPIVDYVQHDETGLVCDTLDAQVLADAVDSLLLDVERARRLAYNAQEYVRTHHPISAVAQQTADIYRRLALAHATFSMKES